MTEDMGLKLLAAIEALTAELRTERDATKTLQAIRERKAARQARWRESRAVDATETLRNGVFVDATPVVVKALKLDQELKDQKQLPPERRNGDATPAPTAATWEAYSAAYEQRHQVRPADGKSERGKLMRFIEKVPREEAPEIAAFFLTHNDSLYIRAKHPIDLLLRDAQKLRTEWKNGQQVTGAEARMEERTHGNVGGWMALDKGKKHGVAGS